ncbi:26S proteasome non-ATPase regulatory subunit 8-like [Paramacrobiotus metropolitanus]|uniref:26S proteasome non-ATPase regulatory subunit 8-like n=1 Tax=Paramacrobiotus metropolitanus TaxID=2943436 RepID=UPI002445B97A|nr:26S proteasome non-ATPase regulatory subunit 8-like [Paramacrobiotus metropolitanus]
MAIGLQNVMGLYRQLTEEWNKRPMEKKKCETLLNNLKVALTEHHFIPTTEGEASKQEIILARDVLEMGAQFAIFDKDLKGFQRHIDQLKVYYYDVKGGIADSAMMNQFLGLYLLSLLAENRLGDFHSEVELMSLDTIEKDPYLRFPVQLERCLMEGSFSKIFVAHKNVPAPSYGYFMELLAKTTRAEIAKCLGRACPVISAETARKMLFLDSEADLKKFADENKWKKQGTSFVFDTERNLVMDELNVDAMDTDREINVADHTALSYSDVAETMLSYAKELEKIV